MLKNVFLIGFLLVSSFLLAQAGFDDDVMDVAVPVDGGITLIVAGAVAYGLHKNKKKDQQ
jgi:hypothetical protein